MTGDRDTVITLARSLLDRLAAGARVERLGVPKMDVVDTYHYANGFVQALETFKLCSPEEAAALASQVAQWPAPIARDGSLWQQPWGDHGTQPLFVKKIHLDVLDMKSPEVFVFECEQCFEVGRFYVDQLWLQDGQSKWHGVCCECQSHVVGEKAPTPPLTEISANQRTGEPK